MKTTLLPRDHQSPSAVAYMSGYRTNPFETSDSTDRRSFAQLPVIVSSPRLKTDQSFGCVSDQRVDVRVMATSARCMAPSVQPPAKPTVTMKYFAFPTQSFLAPMQRGISESSNSSFSTCWTTQTFDRVGILSAYKSRHVKPRVFRPIAWLKFVSPGGHASQVGRTRPYLGDPVAGLRLRASLSAHDTLRYEAHRLIQWQVLGLPAPRLLALGDNFLITADAGPALIRWIAAEPLIRERMTLLMRAAEALGRIHAAGVIHGDPRLGHIAYNGEKITFLHLEEFPVTWVSLAVAQACDALRFFVSAAGALGTAPPSALRRVWAAYLRCAPSLRTVRTIRFGFRLLSWWARIISVVPRHWFRRDAARAWQILSQAV